MALELRPNCEMCDVDLPANAENARICTYECTFCADCVEQKLANVCPNCGSPTRAHHACPTCKTYRGRDIQPLGTPAP